MDSIADSFSGFIEDTAEPPVPTTEKLVEIAETTQRYLEQKAIVDSLSEQLSEANKALARIRESDLPMLMVSCGLTDYTTTDGTKVKVGMDYTAGALRAGPGMEWMDKHGHGDLAKNVIMVTCSKGDDAIADRIYEAIRNDPGANKIVIERDRYVHAQTLKSFVRDRVEHNDPPPFELLGASMRRAAKVTPPKAKLT